MGNIVIEREKLERTLMLLAVATFHTPALQAERTELVEAGLEALAAPVQEPVAFKIYKPTPPQGAIPNVRDAELPWVYDQDPSSGNVASMWVTPVKATPPTAQRQWVGLTEKEILECRSVNHLYFYKAIEAKLKEKNT